MLALEYDKNGNKVQQIDVTGKLTGFDYDPMGQLLRLTDDGQELAVYTYNPDGTPRAVAHGPIRQEYAYDLDKNLTGLTVRSGDALLSHASYAYDGNKKFIRLIRPASTRQRQMKASGFPMIPKVGCLQCSVRMGRCSKATPAIQRIL